MPNLSGAVDEIKNRANIVDVISPLVQLKRAGSNYKGCCPFHKEKTPSFIVSEDKGMYHCFGCGEHGDIFSFIQKYYSLSFPEAVERLAAQYGVVIEQTNSYDDKKRDKYYEINKMAAKYFYEKLSKSANKGYSYLSKRGMDAKTMQSFGIGFATEDWSDLTEYLLSQGVSKEDLNTLSLSSIKGDKTFDKFRSRVMFPIFNTRGKVIGFGGRIVGEGEPKYLNSSENIIFQKKNNLYGLNKTKTAIQEAGYAILVEGYMDCVSLYQYGVQNVVASLGTALTPNQAKLLSRYTKKVVLCYDADNAGINAALRGIDILREANMEVKVLHVDDGKDPDEFVKKHGKEAFIRLVEEKAIADVPYKVNLLRKKYNITDSTEGIKFLKEVANILKGLSPIEADIYAQKIALEYHISEAALKREAQGAKADQKAPERQTEDGAISIDNSDINLEKMIIRLIMLHSSYLDKFKNYTEAFVTNEGRSLFEIFNKKYLSGVDFDLESLKDLLDDNEYAYLNGILAKVATGDDVAACKDSIARLEEKRRIKRLKEIQETLEMADSLPEEDVNQEQMKALLTEYNSLQRKKE